FIFIFNDTATTVLYTLSLHDALPIYPFSGSRQQSLRRQRNRSSERGSQQRGDGIKRVMSGIKKRPRRRGGVGDSWSCRLGDDERSEEHTSELQSRRDLVCRLLLEKKK